MRLRHAALVLWLAFAFVTWNVAFDRAVADAATAFTREQVTRAQQGMAVAPIETAFRPQVRRAAAAASGWAALVLAAGGVLLAVSQRAPAGGRRPRA